MRGRPEEHDCEEDEGGQRQVPGRRRPADERRDRACSSADDDVLRRRAFEEARVDEDVEEVAREREDRGQDVDDTGKEHEREGRQGEAELEGIRRRHSSRGYRAGACALAHQPVDIGVEHVVQGAGAAAR